MGAARDGDCQQLKLQPSRRNTVVRPQCPKLGIPYKILLGVDFASINWLTPRRFPTPDQG